MHDKNFYFTYGKDPSQPYRGGWTIVVAETKPEAMDAFRKRHPDRKAGRINCAGIYSEYEFMRTKMAHEGKNFDHGCWEIIYASDFTNKYASDFTNKEMTAEREGRIIAESVELFGNDKHILIAVEEFSELIKALTMYIRYGDNSAVLENIAEEMASVGIILSHLEYIFGEPVEMEIAKLEKLEKMIEEERANA